MHARFNARFGATTYYPGVVAAAHGDGTCDIAYDDGDREQGVSVHYIKQGQGHEGLGRDVGQVAWPPPPARWGVGQRCDAMDDCSGRWAAAAVVEVDRGGGRVRVHFVGWKSKWDRWLPFASRKLAPPSTKVHTAPVGSDLDSGSGGSDDDDEGSPSEDGACTTPSHPATLQPHSVGNYRSRQQSR